MAGFRSLFSRRSIGIFLIGLGGLLLLLGIVDYRWEVHGVPEAVVRWVERRFAARGLRFEAASLRAGICGGVVVRDLKVDGGLRCPSVSAAVLRIPLAFIVTAAFK